MIPSAGAIIEKEENGETYILIQQRKKKNEIEEYGLWEIPAGKIRQYENVYAALRREVKEETNLDITDIRDEDKSETASCIGYQTANIFPYSIVQNMSGGYSILVMVFLCRAKGEILCQTGETDEVQWRRADEVRWELDKFPEHFFPMHQLTLKKYFREKSTK